eukprot:GILK01002006.1.p1 GENE.GILK01002006.1~~GILK01002006.1.p1  ORF type:complete len:389 (-),score=65.47 GILK01002006.1:163-1281(-)
MEPSELWPGADLVHSGLAQTLLAECLEDLQNNTSSDANSGDYSPTNLAGTTPPTPGDGSGHSDSGSSIRGKRSTPVSSEEQKREYTERRSELNRQAQRAFRERQKGLQQSLRAENEELVRIREQLTRDNAALAAQIEKLRREPSMPLDDPCEEVTRVVFEQVHSKLRQLLSAVNVEDVDAPELRNILNLMMESYVRSKFKRKLSVKQLLQQEDTNDLQYLKCLGLQAQHGDVRTTRWNIDEVVPLLRLTPEQYLKARELRDNVVKSLATLHQQRQQLRHKLRVEFRTALVRNMADTRFSVANAAKALQVCKSLNLLSESFRREYETVISLCRTMHAIFTPYQLATIMKSNPDGAVPDDFGLLDYMCQVSTGS